MTVYVFVNHREVRMIYPALTEVKLPLKIRVEQRSEVGE